MATPLVTEDQLAAAPELAVLAVVGHAAAVARHALFAAHPDLLSGDFLVEEPDVTPLQCLAVALLTALDTLLDAGDHYRRHLDNLAACAAPDAATDPDDDPSF